MKQAALSKRMVPPDRAALFGGWGVKIRGNGEGPETAEARRDAGGSLALSRHRRMPGDISLDKAGHAVKGTVTMSMDATLQVRMDGGFKASVEELYRSPGTSFAGAVRIFVQQRLLAGGMPFRPTLRTREYMTAEELDGRLSRAEANVWAVCSQEALDERVREKPGTG